MGSNDWDIRRAAYDGSSAGELYELAILYIYILYINNIIWRNGRCENTVRVLEDVVPKKYGEGTKWERL